MGINTKNSINLEEDDKLLWKTQTDVANPNGNEMETMMMMW
jgi:hypothetical protein